MDQTDDQLQSLGICHRLFYFIMNALAAHATKPVTLGDPSHCKLTTGSVDDQQSVPMPQTEASERPNTLALSKNEPESQGDSVILIEEVKFDAVKSTSSSCVPEDKAGESAPGASVQKRPAKKMVSIKDEAEVIDLGKKRRRFAFEKQMSSMKNEYNIELRPLKSILRVGSNKK